MSIHKSYKYILIALAIVATQACTKGFEDLNKDPAKASSNTPSQMILGIERTASDIVYDNTVNGTIGMLYAQYYAQTQKENQSLYQLDEGSNNRLWALYSGPLSNAKNLIDINSVTPEPGAKNENAIANILSVWMFQLLTDAYGNVPYSDALQGNKTLAVTYQDSKVIYDSLIDRIDKQIAALDTSVPAFEGTGEVIYNNDLLKWKKLANSLKLRIGTRLSVADPAKAKQLIGEAVQSGVFGSSDDEAKFPYLSTIGSQYPFNDSSGGTPHNDYQVTATLIDMLQQTGDPRLPVYARTAAATKTYVGKAYGANDFGGGYDAYSFPGVKVYSPTFPGYIMSYAEVAFDLAEAAERGFISGSPADYYNKGVLASMQFWGVSDDDANAFLQKNPYKDLNSIATQKWVALYNQGLEAWFERNRLFANKKGASFFVAPAISLDPNIDLNKIIVPYRISYPIAEQGQNRTNYNAAVQALGGTDSKAIELWWQLK